MFDADGGKVEFIYEPDNTIQRVKDPYGKERVYKSILIKGISSNKFIQKRAENRLPTIENRTAPLWCGT